MNNRDLLEQQIRNLFVVDDDSRLVRVNEDGGGRPPLFYMGRCSAGCAPFVRAGTPAHIARRLLDAAANEPATDDFSQPPGVLELATTIARDLGIDPAVRGGPGYVAIEDPPAPDIGVSVIAAGGGLLHPELAAKWGGERLPELELAFGVVVDGQIVALCHSARLGPHDAEAGLETVEAFRRRGFAAAATAAWVQGVRASGRTAFYSTDWENVASQGVARHVGLKLLGELSQVAG